MTCRAVTATVSVDRVPLPILGLITHCSPSPGTSSQCVAAGTRTIPLAREWRAAIMGMMRSAPVFEPASNTCPRNCWTFRSLKTNRLASLSNESPPSSKAQLASGGTRRRAVKKTESLVFLRCYASLVSVLSLEECIALSCHSQRWKLTLYREAQHWRASTCDSEQFGSTAEASQDWTPVG